MTKIEGVLVAGATQEERVEAIIVTSTVLGLADVEPAFRTGSAELAAASTIPGSAQPERQIQEICDEARRNFGAVPELYGTWLLTENVDLNALNQRDSTTRECENSTSGSRGSMAPANQSWP